MEEAADAVSSLSLGTRVLPFNSVVKHSLRL
jgi:hypothetical protein